MSQVDELSAQEQMIQSQVIDRGIRDPRLLTALRSTPRERFLAGPLRGEAFADRPSSIGHGQTISQPYMVALMTHRLNVRDTDRALEVGCGSGYQTAVLSKLAREVWSVERVKPLLDAAFHRFMELNIRNVHLRYGDGTLGWPESAPFDRIVVTAAAPRLPESLLRGQLADGGIAVLPIGPDDKQMLVEVRRAGDRFTTSDICPCRFVKLIGREGWPDAETE